MNPDSDARFPQTRWSLVARLEKPGETEAREALEHLCRNYWAPLYAFARRSGRTPADSEDLVQSFLLKVTSDDLFQRADVEKGKLRTFLLTTFRRFANDESAKANAQKRGGKGRQVVTPDFAGLESQLAENDSKNETAEAFFDRQWAVSIIKSGIATLRSQFNDKGKGLEFDLLRPFLTGPGDGPEFQQIADQLGISPENVKVRVHRLRVKFGCIIREQVSKTLPESADIDEELRYLITLI